MDLPQPIGVPRVINDIRGASLLEMSGKGTAGNGDDPRGFGEGSGLRRPTARNTGGTSSEDLEAVIPLVSLRVTGKPQKLRCALGNTHQSSAQTVWRRLFKSLVPTSVPNPPLSH